MRIGLTSPFAHPEVRRGAERYLHDLAWWLSSVGHEVVILTSTAGPSHTSFQDGATVVHTHRGRALWRGRWRVDDLTRAGLAVGRSLRRRDFDALQCNHWLDGAAARLSRRRYVQWIPGVAHRARLRGRPIHRVAFAAALRGATRIVSLSEHAAATLRDEFGISSDVVPPGVRTSRFAGPCRTEGRSIVLCTAAPSDPRKRVPLLLEAFPTVLAARPDVELVLAPPDPAPLREALRAMDPAHRRHVTVETVADDDELARLYREASVTVLPSLDEAFGLVLVESMAAGTPVVGTDHGAIPEVIADSVGVLAPVEGAEPLGRSILEALELAAEPGIAGRCRAHAARWDWSAVGPPMEQMYAELT